ncbi:aromatic amino acid lyase [Nocardioides marmoraquaticus]
MTVLVTTPDDLDAAAVCRVAAGELLSLAPPLLEQVGARRERLLGLLASGARVYGVTTGAGAQSVVDLDPDAQARQSTSLLLARAVGGPPWLGEAEVRALLAVRLRTLVGPDSGAGPELAAWLVTLLEHRVVPAVPRSGYGSAGEIVPLAHAFGHLGDAGVLLVDGAEVPAGPELAARGLEPPALGAKEGIALLGGVPLATALATLAALRAALLAHQELVVGAAQVVLTGAPRDPYDARVARADDDLAAVLEELRGLVGPEAAPRALQAPVSFRVLGPVLAQVARARRGLDEAVARSLGGVTDSPALVDDVLIGTPGFHGLDLAASSDALRAAAVHAATVGTARLHRLLDPRTTGLPAQLALEPGPHAGLVAVHKRAVGAVHACLPVTATATGLAETSSGQEDVQTFAVDAVETLRRALDAWETTVACGLLAVLQAEVLEPERYAGAPAALRDALASARRVVPHDAADRAYGRDVEALRALLREGWTGEARSLD